jgi:hypothetical protein
MRLILEPSQRQVVHQALVIEDEPDDRARTPGDNGDRTVDARLPAVRRLKLFERGEIGLITALFLLALSVATIAPTMAETSLCGGTRIAIDTSVFSKPFANLTLGDDTGNFLLDTGATHSWVDMRRYGVSEGSKIFLSRFSLPSVQGGVFIATDLRSFSAPPGEQLGIIGTDFLSLRAIEFHYEPSQPFAAVGRKACDAPTLRRAGFVAIGLPGYYEADLSRLKRSMPNVPVIGLRIGGIMFPAQVDTGYGDLPQGVVQVNAALMRILRATEMPIHSLPSDVVTFGCSGTYAYERWQIEREQLFIVTPAGDILASYPPPLIEVKTDAHCSGISTFAEPFAQIGASWLSRWGKSVFDGLSSTIWIPAGR